MMVLYKLDLMKSDLEGAIADWERETEFELPEYARTLVNGVMDARDELDEKIQSHLRDWSVARLGAVERSIMRIATWEMQVGDVPPEVAINEAVELAKRYASPEAAKLVNGTLGAYVRRKD